LWQSVNQFRDQSCDIKFLRFFHSLTILYNEYTFITHVCVNLYQYVDKKERRFYNFFSIFFILIFFSVSYRFIHYLFNFYNIKAKVRYNNGPREFVSHHTEHIFLFSTRFLATFFLALCLFLVTNATLCLPEEFADGRFRWNRAITTRTPRDKSESRRWEVMRWGRNAFMQCDHVLSHSKFFSYDPVPV